MKNLLNKILLVALVVVLGGVLTGCNPEPEKKQFSFAFKGYGPGYVSCYVTVPSPITAYYIVEEEPIEDIDADMIMYAKTMTTFYTDGEHQLLEYPVDENKHYYVYLVADLGGKFSEIYTYEFETGDFEFNQLATVIGVTPDGYKMYIRVPETVRKAEEGQPGSRAIRYNQADLMMYNSLKGSNNDDYRSLLYNAGKYIMEDQIIEYSDKLNYGEAGADINEDGKIDDQDMSILWNPIAPGEPVVFVAGEFEWMAEPDSVKKGGSQDGKTFFVDGFPFPGGWADGYYRPMIDGKQYCDYYGIKYVEEGVEYTPEEDKKDEETAGPVAPATRGAGIINDIFIKSDIDPLWTGQFQRKIFRTRVPAKLNAKFDVRVENLRSVDATITIIPDEHVYRYLFTVLDDGAYKEMLKLLDNKEEYVQWAITSYFAMYNFGQIQVVAEGGFLSAPPIDFNLTDFFYEVPSDKKYHVLITGMSGEIGSPQCFKHYTFATPPKTKIDGPNVVVKALPELSTPYSAAFNIRCTTVENNKAVKAFYAANYKTEWVYAVNGSSTNTYESLGREVQFTEDELAQINSKEGYTIYIPTIDGETTRLVVVAYNDENLSNGIDQYEDPTAHPAVADCTTEYAQAAEINDSDLLLSDELVGDWTLTAIVTGGKVMKQKVSIKRRFVEGQDYPKELPAEIMELYDTTTNWTEEEIKGFFAEFKTLARNYNTNRLRNQNKLLIEGWLNDSNNTLEYLSPWDLFTHETISTVDVASMFARFGPKIYLHINKDVNDRDSLSITANKMFVSPIADWSVPFYMAGRRSDISEGNTIFQWSDEATGGYVAPLEFPVTISEDHQTITIHPFEEFDALWYPNVIGVSESALTGTDYILENPIESAVVLTKGWTEEEVEQEEVPATRASRRSLKGVSPKNDVEFVKYSDRTNLNGLREPIVMEGQVITYEKLQENIEKFHKAYFKRFKK